MGCLNPFALVQYKGNTWESVCGGERDCKEAILGLVSSLGQAWDGLGFALHVFSSLLRPPLGLDQFALG